MKKNIAIIFGDHEMDLPIEDRGRLGNAESCLLCDEPIYFQEGVVEGMNRAGQRMPEEKLPEMKRKFIANSCFLTATETFALIKVKEMQDHIKLVTPKRERND